MNEHLKDLHDWLKKNHPGEFEVMLIKITEKDGRVRWMNCECGITGGGGEMFVLNGRLYYDYEFLWNEDNKWEIVWKSK